MKNKTFFLTILASVILILGFEISAGRIRFGAAYWNDSTTSIITGNKNALINGQIIARDSIDAGAQLSTDAIFFNTLGGVINFGGYNSYIQEDVNKLYYATTTHKFTTPTGTDLLTIDSANGFSRYEPGLGWGGNLVKTKLVKFATTSGSLPAWIASAHGLTGSKIINATCFIKADTTGWNISGSSSNNDNYFPPRCPLTAAGTYDFMFDEANVLIYLASTATAIRNNTDTAFVWITYIQ